MVRLSQRAALRATGLMGSASAANLLIGLVRMKIVALLVGATGVGLIGIYQNFMNAAATIGGLGVATAAPREIAAQSAAKGPEGEAAARRAVMTGALVLALVAAAIVFLFREPLAATVFGTTDQSAAVGWLGVGVGLSILYAAQSGILSGTQRIADLARVTLFGAVLGSIAGVLAVWLLPSTGILLYVISAPAGAALVGSFFILRLPRASQGEAGPATFLRVWRDLVTLGAATMAGGFVAAAGPLLVRIAIGDRMGLHELGLFQASWALASVYLGVVLQAMSADYFPRLTREIRDPSAAMKTVNAQTEIALLLSGPVILVIMGGGPLILQLLYTREFEAAAAMLRWQMLGDVLKVMSWPLGFVLLASRRGLAFLAVETVGTAIFVVATLLLLNRLGFVSAGLGYALMYAVYLPILLVICRRQIGFPWKANVLLDAGFLLMSAATVMIVAAWNESAGLVLGVLAAVAFAVRAYARFRGQW